MTRLTRQHFRVIAECVKATRDAAEPNSKSTADEIAERLANELDEFNPNFDRQRFLTACGFLDE